MEKEITLHAYGIAAEILGKRQTILHVTPNHTAAQIKTIILERYPELGNINGFQLAFGNNFAQEEDIISGETQVSILPPVSGG